MTNSSEKTKGFTIVETLAVIAITALVFAAVSWAVVSFYRANAYIIQQSYAVNSARLGIETMVREIREASYSDTGAFPVESASSSEFVFYSDVDRDKNVERVRYTINGTNLERGETEATGSPPVYGAENESVSVLSEHIRNSGSRPVFTYYDSSGEEMSAPLDLSKISLVKINLVVNVVEGRAPDEFTLRSTAQIRNLKTNL